MKPTVLEESDMRKIGVVCLAVALLISYGCGDKKDKPAPLSIETTSLSDGVEGAGYTCTLQGSGGHTANYQWSAAGLPSGLAVDAATGEISGTLGGNTAAGSPYTVTVTLDDGSKTVQKDLVLNVYAVLQITTSSPLPDAVQGGSYQAQLNATGGTGAYTWTETTNNLATYNLTLNADGTVTGTPNSTGTVTFTAQVTDDADPAQSASKQFSLTICLLYTSPSPRDLSTSRMPSSA